MAGKVYLVGAGPGDYRLLTLKACDCLRQAEVVVYDRLADARILQYVPETAERIYVGKAASQHTMRQNEINQLLVEKAQEGKCVVRLKGGDPFVFGRGGEEALQLKEKGIPFAIVPGVTSAIAVAAYAGIPVTHRGVAASFAVVTGHEDPTKPDSTIHWKTLATATDTLVFLMGVGNLPKITARLIEYGRDPETPAALIRWGTKPEQEVLVTTVARAAHDAAEKGLKPPAIFLVGDVVRLREKIAWFDVRKTHPLFGKTILVTRARAQASELTTRLEALGARCIEAPVIRLAEPGDNGAALQAACKAVETYDWLLFTSVNGVERFFAQLLAAGKDVRSLAKAKLAAIGPATAKSLQAYGLRADVVPKAFRAEDFLQALRGRIHAGERVLLPRAEEARAVLPEGLRALGAEVTVVPVYRTVLAAENSMKIRALFQEGAIDWVTFTSSSTARNLQAMLGDDFQALSARTACIGPVTAATCRELGILPTVVAESYTLAGLVEALLAAEK